MFSGIIFVIKIKLFLLCHSELDSESISITFMVKEVVMERNILSEGIRGWKKWDGLLKRQWRN